jgi:CSLREA domain-containing protein
MFCQSDVICRRVAGNDLLMMLHGFVLHEFFVTGFLECMFLKNILKGRYEMKEREGYWKKVALLCVVFLFCISNSLFAMTFVVNSTLDEGDADAADGLCVSLSGNCTLRAAVEQANSLYGSDEVLLADEEYLLTDGNIEISDDVEIRGQGRDVTVIRDGENIGDGGIFSIQGVNVKISRTTISGGSSGNNGGAIYNDGGSLMIFRCRLTGNGAATSGGGIYNNGGDVQVQRTEFKNNGAEVQGGALCNSNYGTCNFLRCVFEDNSSNVHAGALCNVSGNVYVRRCDFISNNANPTGAVLNYGNLYVFRSFFYENISETGDGGGIYNEDTGYAAIMMSEINGNLVYTGGGGVYNAGEMLIRNSAIFDNESDEDGGGIYLASGALKIISSRVVDNHAGVGFSGGGIYNAGGALDVIRTVVAGNTPDDCAPDPCP